MYISECNIRVRYGETDQMGYVYYGNYALYYEEARTNAIRLLGITYKELEENGIMMPVINSNITNLRPVYYDELLTIRCSIPSISKEDTEIIFEGEIINEKGKKVNEGIIRLAFVDMQTRRKTTIPDILYDKLKPYFKT